MPESQFDDSHHHGMRLFAHACGHGPESLAAGWTVIASRSLPVGGNVP